MRARTLMELFDTSRISYHEHSFPCHPCFLSNQLCQGSFSQDCPHRWSCSFLWFWINHRKYSSVVVVRSSFLVSSGKWLSHIVYSTYSLSFVALVFWRTGNRGSRRFLWLWWCSCRDSRRLGKQRTFQGACHGRRRRKGPTCDGRIRYA